jgi:hypothetical protein
MFLVLKLLHWGAHLRGLTILLLMVLSQGKGKWEMEENRWKGNESRGSKEIFAKCGDNPPLPTLESHVTSRHNTPAALPIPSR